MSDTELLIDTGAARGDVRWLSANPAKAWSERWFLLYSPCWMLAMGVVMLSGLDESRGAAWVSVSSLACAGISSSGLNHCVSRKFRVK